MVSIGTPLSSSATKVMLCGAGELGKEVAIELQRLGVEVICYVPNYLTLNFRLIEWKQKDFSHNKRTLKS